MNQRLHKVIIDTWVWLQSAKRWRAVFLLWLGLLLGMTDPQTALASLNTPDLSRLTVQSNWPTLLGLKVESLPSLTTDIAKPPTVQSVLLRVCVERGYGEDCARTLLGMAWKESRFEGNAIGDKGLALGYFQIHYRMHKVPAPCARDLKCSANWTISYLESNGYPKYVKTAVQCHNGCGVANGYAGSALAHGNRLWGQSLALLTSDVVRPIAVVKVDPLYHAALVK